MLRLFRYELDALRKREALYPASASVSSGGAGHAAKVHELVSQSDARDRELGLIDAAVDDVAQRDFGDRHARPGKVIAQLERLIGAGRGLRRGQGEQQDTQQRTQRSRKGATDQPQPPARALSIPPQR